MAGAPWGDLGRQPGSGGHAGTSSNSHAGADPETSARCGGGSGGMARYTHHLDDNTCDYIFPPFQAAGILGRQWGAGDSCGAVMDTTMMTTAAMAAIAAGRWWQQRGDGDNCNSTGNGAGSGNGDGSKNNTGIGRSRKSIRIARSTVGSSCGWVPKKLEEGSPLTYTHTRWESGGNDGNDRGRCWSSQAHTRSATSHRQ